MTMQKFADGEGELEVLRGRQANVLHSHMARLGKYSVEDFSDADRESLREDLAEAKKLDDEDAAEAQEKLEKREERKAEKQESKKVEKTERTEASDNE